MKFDFDNNIPIYIQLVEQLKIYIISGKFKPGDRMASVRDLAFQTKVNPNTMQKALVELENLGLIYTERTNGKFVTTDEKLIKKYRNEYASNLSKQYFYNMKNIGINEKEAIEYLKNIGGNK
ncbi:MAG: GntR family transcriptional regulator [Bacilli bacterium]|nr:GntR family transcriptional regulator [Bacilli bacterium]